MSKKIDALLDIWLKNNLNVMLSGAHGFGKTERATQCFERNGLKWRYFSASTMDPWVDFVGVPKEVTDEATGERYLELIRPRDFAHDDVEALFFDEFNRAPKKVRNAVMELIQFKSINGRKFHNLRVIWIAINPADENETYDVERMDPAQEDRFHIHFEVPAVPDLDYFTSRYGKDVATVALEWWKAIPDEFRKGVSGRRLQYLLDHWRAGENISYMVHKKTNPNKLVTALASGSVVELLRALIENDDKDGIKKFLKKENNYAVAADYIKENPGVIAKIIPAIDEERLQRLMKEIPTVMAYITADANAGEFISLLQASLNAGTLDPEVAKRIRTILSRKVTSTSPNGPTTYQPVSLEPMDLAKLNLLDFHRINVQFSGVENVQKAYEWLETELAPMSKLDSIVAVCYILFRAVEEENANNIPTRYPLWMPMLNFCIAELGKMQLEFNSPIVKNYFTSDGKYKITHRVRVQGFIDANRQQLIDQSKKPRI